MSEVGQESWGPFIVEFYKKTQSSGSRRQGIDQKNVQAAIREYPVPKGIESSITLPADRIYLICHHDHAHLYSHQGDENRIDSSLSFTLSSGQWRSIGYSSVADEEQQALFELFESMQNALEQLLQGTVDF